MMQEFNTGKRGPEPRLAAPLRQAEAAIDDMVTAPSADWTHGKDYQWSVGANVAKTDPAMKKPDVIVAQTLAPNPDAPVKYSARTPYGDVTWREGATDLHHLRRPDGSSWGNLAMAEKAIGAIGAATVVEIPQHPGVNQQQVQQALEHGTAIGQPVVEPAQYRPPQQPGS